MNELDLDAIRTSRARALRTGLLEVAGEAPRQLLAPEIEAVWLAEEGSTFVLVLADGRCIELPTRLLPSLARDRVLACSVDGFRRGVEVVLDDGRLASFSAEYALYATNQAFRSSVDAATSRRRGDLAAQIGARVSRARQRRGWTVTKLAERSGLASPNVHRLESGRHVPTHRTLQKVARALAVPVAKLLGH